MHKTLKYSLIACATLLIAAAGLVTFMAQSGHVAINTAQPLAFIENLKPGTGITYEITINDNQKIQKHFVADEQGQSRLTLNNDISNIDEIQNIAVNIEQESNPLSLRLTKDPASKAFSLHASGLREFSDIEYEGQDQKTIMKADWAGEFEYILPGMEEKSEEPDKHIQLAFHGTQLLPDSVEQNPLKIQVLDTSGGGTQGSGGVNEYTEESCGNPELSTCQGLGGHTASITGRYVVSLQEMTMEFSVMMMKYVDLIGQILDAKMQLQTQAQMQKMMAQAHKDYHPSEQMCRFGSFVKNMASVEETAKYNKLALNKVMMDRFTHTRKLSSPIPQEENDLQYRIQQFRSVYCDPRDFNNGLEYMCQENPSNPDISDGERSGGTEENRLNKDIDFIRTVDTPLTLNVNFTDGELVLSDTDPDDKSFSDEEDVIALAKNLYWPNVFSRTSSQALEREFRDYLNARHLMAVQNVAHNSYANLVAMKSESLARGTKSASSFMKAFMRDFGLSDDEIDSVLGINPSYYAQMEVLTKKIYQDPDFYTNLLDKPSNLKRINASMEAIKLMQMRDWFEANLRKEMLTSLILEKNLQTDILSVSQRLERLGAAQ